MASKNGVKSDLKQKKESKAAKGGSGTEKAPEKPSEAASVFRMVGQYVKDLSFECPRPAFLVPARAQNMDINIGVQTATLSAESGLHEVALALRARGFDEADKSTLFVAEVAYAGVFEAKNITESQLNALLGVDGAALIFPFARQILMQSITEGGFRPPMLEPVNFAALYTQQGEPKE